VARWGFQNLLLLFLVGTMAFGFLQLWSKLRLPEGPLEGRRTTIRFASYAETDEQKLRPVSQPLRSRPRGKDSEGSGRSALEKENLNNASGSTEIDSITAKSENRRGARRKGYDGTLHLEDTCILQ
jgi:hypothetical protein